MNVPVSSGCSRLLAAFRTDAPSLRSEGMTRTYPSKSSAVCALKPELASWKGPVSRAVACRHKHALEPGLSLLGSQVNAGAVGPLKHWTLGEAHVSQQEGSWRRLTFLSTA